MIVLLVLLFHAGGGWYFSNQIREEIDTDDPPTAAASVVVSADAEAVVVGDSTVAVDQLTAIEWPGGVQRLGIGVASGEDQRRPVELGPVDPAGVVAPVGSVRTNAYYFVSNPKADLGLDYDDVDIPCATGTCPAWFVPGDDDTWVILTHGLGVDRTETLRMLQVVTDLGYPALAITYRNDAGAPQTDGLVRFGQEEAADLQAAIDYAQSQGAADVVLAGFSTGGAISLAVAMDSPDEQAIRALLIDGPMVDFPHTVELAAADRTLPVIGLPIPTTLIWSAKQIAAWRFGLDYDAIDYESRAAELATPTLVLMGTDDTKVYPEPARELAAASEFVTLSEYPGAGHVRSWNVDRERYTREVTAFLAEHAG